MWETWASLVFGVFGSGFIGFYLALLPIAIGIMLPVIVPMLAILGGISLWRRSWRPVWPWGILIALFIGMISNFNLLMKYPNF